MIDIENQVFNLIALKVRSEHGSDLFVAGEYVRVPASFPAVTIEERANSVYVRSQDSGSLENHARVMYEINVYSNKTVGKKRQCKDILSTIDDEFKSLGFTREMSNSILNLEDATIYRMVARYTAVVSKDHRIYRR